MCVHVSIVDNIEVRTNVSAGCLSISIHILPPPLSLIIDYCDCGRRSFLVVLDLAWFVLCLKKNCSSHS